MKALWTTAATLAVLMIATSVSSATITSPGSLALNTPSQTIPVANGQCGVSAFVTVVLDGDGKDYTLDFTFPNRCRSGARTTLASFVVNGIEQFGNFSFSPKLESALDAGGDLVNIGLTDVFRFSFTDNGTNPLGSFSLSVTQIPVPASAMLLLSSLLALGIRRKRFVAPATV